MAKEKTSVFEILRARLEDEMEYKKQCDAGEVSYWNQNYDEHMLMDYLDKNDETEGRAAHEKKVRWNQVIKQFEGMDPEEIAAGVQTFLEEYGSEEYKIYIPDSFISSIETFTRRTRFEQAIMRDDVVEYFSSKTKKELEREFGKEVARMKDFDQKNPHHCYDLLGHTLHTVDGIKRDGLTPEQYKELRIAAFLHDIGKPEVARMHPKIEGQQVFYGHAKKSAEIAYKMLTGMGYDLEEATRMQDYIAHHDDFISYKPQEQITPALASHEFIRGITPESIAEIMIQNRYGASFEEQGYNADQIRYACYALAHGTEPKFVNYGRPVNIDLSMSEVVGATLENYDFTSYSIGETDVKGTKLFEGRYTPEFYRMLMHLCRADARAQSEIAIQQGKKVGSREEKVATFDAIEAMLPEAQKTFDLARLSNAFIGNISMSSPDLSVLEQDEMEEEFDDFDEEFSSPKKKSGIEYDEYGDELPDSRIKYREHRDIDSWVELMGQSSEFLTELRARIETKREMGITEDRDAEFYNEQFDNDLKELDRIIKIRTRRENLKPLEAQLAEAEAEEKKITEAEQMLLQLRDEKRKGEGR